MWKAVVLAVCLLVAEVQPMDDPTYGVKLCGREFIRAVIFTCGGSRWKRSLTSAGEKFKFRFFSATNLMAVITLMKGELMWSADCQRSNYIFIERWCRLFSQCFNYGHSAGEWEPKFSFTSSSDVLCCATYVKHCLLFFFFILVSWKKLNTTSYWL